MLGLRMTAPTAAILWAILAGLTAGIAVGILIGRAWSTKYLRCMHHDSRGGWVTHQTGEAVSWVSATMADTGMRKLFTCSGCGKTWTT